MSKNARTGLILASIAAAWFLGLILKYWIMGG
ncbi:MAG: cytochrome oxidase small assembly protein [Betaproteobacteria bacterium]|nr:cytochrome oxidase small assembly protein [Betaproteobacteria bacterium]